MKIMFLFLCFLLWGNNIKAQGFYAHNQKVEQGGILVMSIDPRWRAPGLPGSAISIFGNHYLPNQNGDVFIGISVYIKPGRYKAHLVEYGRGVRLNSDYEVEVLKTNFSKTRTVGVIRSNRPRMGPELIAINKAFDLTNKSGDDLTAGLAYVEPFINHQGVIDPFGLIYRNNPDRVHGGVDLRMPVGTVVRAMNQGVVVLTANNFSKEGNMIILYHGLGIFSVYMHLSRVDVSENSTVKRGDIVGLSGDTGAGVREPHLHFSVKIIKSYINPLVFIDEANKYLK